MMRLYFCNVPLVLVSNSGCSSHVDYESIDSLKRRPEFRATVDEVLIRDEYTPGKTFAMLTLRLANGSKKSTLESNKVHPTKIKNNKSI